MGLSDSTLKSLTKPCETCIHDTNRYCLDDCEFDSGCGCCNVHLKTNAHKGDEEESEPEENA